MLAANRTGAGMTAHVAGQGPSVVMLHSLLADRGSLEPMIPLLEAEFRLVLIDLPGFGGSQRCEPTVEALADSVADAVRALCPGETPILFGNGYGSFVALAAALRHPALASGLCLAGCGAGFSEEGRKAFRFMAARAREAGLEAIADVAMRRLFPPEMAERMPDLVRLRRESFLATDTGVFSDACGVLATLDLREELKSLAVPLLACVGEFDEATPPAMARELASLVKRGEFHLIENCAHAPTLQSPDQVASLLRDNLALLSDERSL